MTEIMSAERVPQTMGYKGFLAAFRPKEAGCIYFKDLNPFSPFLMLVVITTDKVRIGKRIATLESAHYAMLEFEKEMFWKDYTKKIAGITFALKKLIALFFVYQKQSSTYATFEELKVAMEWQD